MSQPEPTHDVEREAVLLRLKALELEGSQLSTEAFALMFAVVVALRQPPLPLPRLCLRCLTRRPYALTHQF